MQYWMNQGTTMRFNDLEKDIEYCKRYGFQAIELKYNLVSNYELTWVRDLLLKNRVGAGSIGALQLPILQGEETRCQMEKKLHTLCQYAHVLEAFYVVAIPPRSESHVKWDDIQENVVEILNRYSEIADEYQIKIAIEITGFADSYLNTIEKGLKIIRQVKKNNLGLIYDLYHVLGMKDLGQAVLDAEPEDIFIVHINDGLRCAAGQYQDDNRLWPGDGDVDMTKQIGMLNTIGYRGPFSMEVYQPQIWSCDMQECYRIAWDKMRGLEQLVSI